MQNYIDIIIKYWFIFLPLGFAIIFVIWLLIKRGYLHEIDLFGFKINLKQEISNSGKYIDNPQNASPSIRDYDIRFNKTAKENLSTLNITQEAVIRLVENEFTHHVNYFKWDLLDYPLPLQDGYIAIIDKIGKTVTFRGVKRANINELELASLTDLLAIYRRLTRFEYRLNKNVVLRPETISMIVDQHKETIRRLIRHFELFKKTTLPGKEKFPLMFLDYLSEADQSTSTESKLKEFIRKIPSDSQGFGHNVIAAISALRNMDQITANEVNNLMSQEEADKEVIICLERSLQYIHKMINTCLE